MAGKAVLLHGFMGSRVQMLPFAGALTRAGWRVRNHGYESKRFNIEGHAEILLRDLQNLPHGKMAFVTHSFGGVVLRAALSHPDCPEPAREARIVLVAPPLCGSALARRMNSLPRGLKQVAEAVMGQASGAQLRNLDSLEFQSGLGSFPTGSRILLVVGNAGGINPLLSEQSDGVVTVDEVTAGITQSHRRLIVGLTHNILIYSPKVISQAVAFLGGNDEIGEQIHPLGAGIQLR